MIFIITKNRKPDLYRRRFTGQDAMSQMSFTPAISCTVIRPVSGLDPIPISQLFHRRGGSTGPDANFCFCTTPNSHAKSSTHKATRAICLAAWPTRARFVVRLGRIWGGDWVAELAFYCFIYFYSRAQSNHECDTLLRYAEITRTVG